MKIFITGSESTGKTEMAKYLADRFGVPWVPEYARDYIEKLERPYRFEDVEIIARQQVFQIEEQSNRDLVFFDTGLIITRIWFQRKFGELPAWFDKKYRLLAQGHYLVCHFDLPWLSDPVRENPDIRQVLDEDYVREIVSLKTPWKRVSGFGEIRKENAYKIVKDWIDLKNE